MILALRLYYTTFGRYTKLHYKIIGTFLHGSQIFKNIQNIFMFMIMEYMHRICHESY